jgi:hypothetical protein
MSKTLLRWCFWTVPLVSAAAPLAGCGSSDPFHYVQVSGKVTYEDGTPIPVEPLILRFIPQGGQLDAKTYPRPGMAMARKADGTFSQVTSHKAGDGLAAGHYKVALTDLNGSPLDPRLVPREYADPATTPLEVDTSNPQFTLTVRKP